MKKLKMARSVTLTFEEGYNKYLENCSLAVCPFYLDMPRKVCYNYAKIDFWGQKNARNYKFFRRTCG